MRIRMPKGMLALSLAGVEYKPDETGAFDVPDAHGKSLIEVHGGVLEAAVADHEAMVAAAELRVAQAKQAVEVAEADLVATREAAAKAKAAQAKAAAEKVATIAPRRSAGAATGA